MSNTINMNQAKNFWDFVANLQHTPGAFPFADSRGPPAEFDPFEGQQFNFWGPVESRHARGHGPPRHGRRGPSPPPAGQGHRGPSPPPAGQGHEHHGPVGGPPPPHPGNESDSLAPPHSPPVHGHQHRGPHSHPHGPPHRHGRTGHRGQPPHKHDGAVPPPPLFDEPVTRSPTPPTPPETPAEPHHHPRSQSPRHHPHAGHRGPPPQHRRGGRFGGRGGHYNHPRGNNGPALPFDLGALAEAFAAALFSGNAFAGPSAATKTNTKEANNNDGTFTPSMDVFSTPTSYILHASLPGAKKSEIDVTYSAARNSISISGVITRPDMSESTMNCLVTDERREIGIFEREIRLEDGVKIDEENIGAKLEDGVLRVVVPKIGPEEEEGWESVRKVELE